MSDYTSLYITLFEPLHTLFKIVVLGIATGAISLALTKSAVFNCMHDWLEKHIPFLGEMLNCPWCTSHWVALFFTLIYRPLLLDWTDRPVWMASTPLQWFLVPVDYLVSVMVIVAIASVVARIIYSAYKPLMG